MLKCEGSSAGPTIRTLLLPVRNGSDLRFYYPDATIHCGPVKDDARVIDDPKVIFEVLSESKARTDTGEKRMAYLTIATLEAYVLVDSTQRAVTVWRRQGATWSHEVYCQPEARLTFINDEYQLLVGEIYESSGL